MEKNNKENKEQYCACMNCTSYMGMGYHRHFLLRWLLGILIILMVFGLGVKVGEFKGFFESDNGFGMMNHHRFFNQNTYNPGYMMQQGPLTNTK